MNPIGNFPKKFVIFHSFRSKAEKHSSLCLYICVGEFCPVFLANSPWIYIVLTAMKRGDEALNASWLQFLSIDKCFIAAIFSQRYTLHRC
jgi:hypothetical protein